VTRLAPLFDGGPDSPRSPENKSMHTRSAASFAAAAALVAACSDSPTQSSLAPEAPSLAAAAASENAQVIPGRFIVTLREGVSPAAVAAEHGVRPDFVYTTVLNGFAGAMSDAARDGLLRDARVSRVEPDGVAHTTTTQTNPTWGLDRIDQRENTLSKSYAYNNTGAGVTVYIIDTGILTGHTEFGGRASIGTDKVNDGKATGGDCNGHGTHVAGTVGGATYGVAKGVKLVAVRVLDCAGSGTWSGVIAGMDWATANHVEGTPAVANMSLGGGASSSVDDGVRRMIADGITTAVAAGNGNQGGRQQNACNYSPARVPDAITVGATTQSDTKTSWSNYGDCVDIFAPGYQITSSWYTSTTATNTISGTSMASPHVAGVAALYLQSNSSASPTTVAAALSANATKGIVKNSYTAKNDLLFTAY
jgi:subtilisin family serine protease